VIKKQAVFSSSSCQLQEDRWCLWHG